MDSKKSPFQVDRWKVQQFGRPGRKKMTSEQSLAEAAAIMEQLEQEWQGSSNQSIAGTANSESAR